MRQADRKLFDTALEQVLRELPEDLKRLLDEVPLIVDDLPSRSVLAKARLKRAEFLCGLYSGIPLTKRSVRHSGTLPEVIHLFRAGIIAAAQAQEQRRCQPALKEQIRRTLLHEIGHHFGLGEEDLRKYGY